ncbi:MAG: hypothetical protein B1H09_01230 [Gemmatimonadaceae bacterium 4484_173]|nr:MAG: hypothetical protein B1H09_01230 [Gemmatimonadaceae bacterium 4484_173]RKZ03659.1 MAG: 4Fe-4S dicluster domain-containing protein [Candidatus Fermentibacteria bacterium]
MMQLVVRADLCTGCMNCQTVCSLHHRSVSAIQVNLEVFSGLNTVTWCRQCEDPECLAVCPTDAIHRNKHTGAWEIDHDTCISCGNCVSACPYSAMFQTEPGTIPFKCDLCGGTPLCAEACAFGAITLEEIPL